MSLEKGSLTPFFLHNGRMSNSADSINYVYDFVPEIGEARDVLPGLKWLRLPLPFLLGHINVWLLRTATTWADGFTPLVRTTPPKVAPSNPPILKNP